jgi:RNA polymerase sigma-70 factor, ECF subfamily
VCSVPVSGGVSLDEAMDRYASGDDQAFALVYARLGPRLYAFVRRLCGSRTLAEDLVQESLLRLHRARGTFQRHAAALPWAYAIARNVWLEHVRSSRARMAVGAELADPSTAEPPAPPDTDSEQTLLAHETAALLERALGALPRSQREAFVLLRYEGLTLEEAASVAGTTRTAIKLRAFRAHAALRRALTGGSGGQHG